MTAYARGVTQEGLSSNSVVDVPESKSSLRIANLTENEALLTDIPFPMGVQFLEEYYREPLSEQNSFVVGFIGDITQETVKEFYRYEMELYGWRLAYSIEGFESVLVYEKPKRTGILVLRPLNTSKTQGVFFITQRVGDFSI